MPSPELFHRTEAHLARAIAEGDADPRTLDAVKAIAATCNPFDAIVRCVDVIRTNEQSHKAKLDRLFRAYVEKEQERVNP